MAPKSSSTAPEMRTRAPTLSSLAGLEGFTVTVAYACGRAGGREKDRHVCTQLPGPPGWEWDAAHPRLLPAPLSLSSRPRVPGPRAWMCPGQTFRGAGTSLRGSPPATRRSLLTLAPSHPLGMPAPLHKHTRGAPPQAHIWTPQFAPTSQVWWHKSLTRDRGSRPRVLGLPGGTHRGAAKLNVVGPHQGDGHFVRVLRHGCCPKSRTLGGSARVLGSVLLPRRAGHFNAVQRRARAHSRARGPPVPPGPAQRSPPLLPAPHLSPPFPLPPEQHEPVLHSGASSSCSLLHTPPNLNVSWWG